MIKPFRFLQNRVLRLYLGGSGIDRLCHNPEIRDTRFPENWIASCIEGNGRAYHSPGHGISKLEYEGTIHLFPDFLQEHAEDILGKKHVERFGYTPAVLTKLLDSAEQLPMQVHPTRKDAKTYFNADYGKTEAWLILSTRTVDGEEPYLLVGFNHQLDKDTFIKESIDGEYHKGLQMLNKIPVKPGDVIVIHGGLPHAIGPGVTMVEVMEPSDLVIVPEINCCGVQLNPQQRFAGISAEDAMKLFDTTPRSVQEIYQLCTPTPSVIETSENGSHKWLIPYEACGFFAVQELTFKEQWNLQLNDDMCRIGVVCEGNLKLDDLTLNPGDNFLIPQCCKSCNITGNGKIMLILPPKP